MRYFSIADTANISFSLRNKNLKYSWIFWSTVHSRFFISHFIRIPVITHWKHALPKGKRKLTANEGRSSLRASFFPSFLIPCYSSFFFISTFYTRRTIASLARSSQNREIERQRERKTVTYWCLLGDCLPPWWSNIVRVFAPISSLYDRFEGATH